MKVNTGQFSQKAKQELRDPYTQRFLKILPTVLAEQRRTAYSTLPDPEAVHEYGQAIRAEAVERLGELLEEFERKATRNGAEVFWAKDAVEANDYIIELARAKGVRYVTKGKSMVTEEMGLNDAFEAAGVEAWETDLGEFITQLLRRPPFHIVGPAINVPVEHIRDVFLERGVLDRPTADPVELGRAARVYLRKKFQHLEMGVTGINFAVAETGAVINVENEGNIRFNKSSPRTQVSVMTIEKVLPTMADAAHMLRVLCRSASGQSLGVYVSMDCGPKRADEIDGPEELHIVILDNGRSRVYQDPDLRQALRCIRCGACLNICPVYGRIGGYPYGWAYSGPMGQVLNPLLLGLDRTKDLYQACTLCKKCKTVCPAGIDHPHIILSHRAGGVAEAGVSIGESAPYRALALAAGRPWLWRVMARGMHRFLRRACKAGKPGRGPVSLASWLRSRDLPPTPDGTFHDRWKELTKDN